MLQCEFRGRVPIRASDLGRGGGAGIASAVERDLDRRSSGGRSTCVERWTELYDHATQLFTS